MYACIICDKPYDEINKMNNYQTSHNKNQQWHALTSCVFELIVPVYGLRSGSWQAGHFSGPLGVRDHHYLHQVVKTTLDHTHLQVLTRRQVPQKTRQQLSHLWGARLLQQCHDFSEPVVAADQLLVLVHGAAEGEVLESSESSDLDFGLWVTQEIHQDGNGSLLSNGKIIQQEESENGYNLCISVNIIK